jgi:hypothetical protein
MKVLHSANRYQLYAYAKKPMTGLEARELELVWTNTG